MFFYTTKFYNTSSFYYNFALVPFYIPVTDIVLPGHYKVTVSVFQGSSECPVHCVTEWRPGEEMAEAVLRQELSNFHETVSHFSAH